METVKTLEAIIIKYCETYLVMRQDATSRPNLALGSNENLRLEKREILALNSTSH